MTLDKASELKKGDSVFLVIRSPLNDTAILQTEFLEISPTDPQWCLLSFDGLSCWEIARIHTDEESARSYIREKIREDMTNLEKEMEKWN